MFIAGHHHPRDPTVILMFVAPTASLHMTRKLNPNTLRGNQVVKGESRTASSSSASLVVVDDSVCRVADVPSAGVHLQDWCSSNWCAPVWKREVPFGFLRQDDGARTQTLSMCFICATRGIEHLRATEECFGDFFYIFTSVYVWSSDTAAQMCTAVPNESKGEESLRPNPSWKCDWKSKLQHRFNNFKSTDSYLISCFCPCSCLQQTAVGKLNRAESYRTVSWHTFPALNDWTIIGLE